MVDKREVTSSEVELRLKKLTKGTAVYENGEKGFPGVYIPRKMIPAPPPPTLTLRISWGEEE